MNHATVTFSVYGDHHAELKERAEDGLAAYLGVEVEDLPSVAMYEMQVEEYVEMDSEYNFKATVIARVK